MEFIDQSHKDLVYRFREGLNVPHSKAISTCSMYLDNGDVNISANIIGGSHWIMFNGLKLTMVTEILACCPTLYNDGVENILGNNTRLENGFENDEISYTFNLYVDNTKISVPKIYLDDKAIETASICVKFPSNDGTPMSKTCIGLSKLSEEEIVIRTLHEYPNEEKNVITRTNFRIKK